jgi:hypothetical protein
MKRQFLGVSVPEREREREREYWIDLSGIKLRERTCKQGRRW